MKKVFKIEQTGDRQVNQLQANIKQATDQLRQGPFGDGNLVTVTFASAGTQIVDHGLGRLMQGFVATSPVYGGNSFSSPFGSPLVQTTQTTDLTKRVPLYCAFAPVTWKVWFF